nr:hypothetical protein [Tanacetum cinerariifolium]
IGEEAVPKAGLDDVSKAGVDLPDLPKAGDEEAPKPDVEPTGEDAVPKAGLEDVSKAGVDLPKAGDEEPPKTVVDPSGEEACVQKNPPVLLELEHPVCAPKGDIVPNGFLNAILKVG